MNLGRSIFSPAGSDAKTWLTSKDYKEVKNRDGTTRVVLNKEVLARAAMRLKERHHLLAKYWRSQFAKTPAEESELLESPTGS